MEETFTVARNGNFQAIPSGPIAGQPGFCDQVEPSLRAISSEETSAWLCRVCSKTA